MFSGGGFGVGLTVNQLDAPPRPGQPGVPEPGEHPARLGELMPVAARTDAELAEEMRRASIAESRLWAYRTELVASLAARRGRERDCAREQRGAASASWTTPSHVLESCSEFLPDELAMVLNCSRTEATRLAEVALTLVHRLPETWAALADGELNWPRARAIAREINRYGPDVDPHVVATVDAVVAAQAAELSVTRLRALVRAEMVRRDAEAAERRREQAALAADVRLRRTAEEGMSEVAGLLPHPIAVAVRNAVDAHARRAKAEGDPRPIGLIRAEVFAHLLLRPGDEFLPAVTAEVRILAPLNALLPDPADPAAGGIPTGIADVEGEPITAAHLRALLTALDSVCPGGLQSPTGGSLHLDLLGAGGDLRATLTRADLERAVRRGCRDHCGQECRCDLLPPPPPTDSYTPTAPQQRFVDARDRTCRHPGCHIKAGWADLDHVIPHAQGGPTDCDNLCCLCRRHHRLKTHAPGWIFRLDADGALLVTTPSGVTRISRPPGADFLEPYELGPPPPGVELIDVPPF